MSEFREDIVSGDWIVMAPERSLRPHDFSKSKKREKISKKNCPFEPESLRVSRTWPPTLAYPEKGEWQVVLVSNKYPALRHALACAQASTSGPYPIKEGIGYHDLLITRDHHNNFAALEKETAYRVLEMMQKRFKQYAKDKCVSYASAFFNWGPGAGASVYHPHYQILALPIIPPDVFHSLRGSELFYRKHKVCVHCRMLKHELKEKKRIVAENKEAVAIAPFVSRMAYEVRIFPKAHDASFELSPEKRLRGVAALLQETLRRIKKKLGDPDLNAFVHTAPLSKKHTYGYYHWHIEIVPKISFPAGFELSTGIEINGVDPDEAALLLRRA